MFKYEGYAISTLAGMAKNGDQDAVNEIAFRNWAYVYLPVGEQGGFLASGQNTSPFTCNPQQGRPADRQPPNVDPPPRPKLSGGGSAGGGGGTWKPLNDIGDLILIFE